MATLMLNTAKNGSVKGFILKTTYEERHIAKSAGGRWDASLQCWKLPLDVEIDTLVRNTYLYVSDDAREFLAKQQKTTEHLVKLHSAKDAIVKYPQRLDPYQRVGVRFLADAGSAILADEMGLGKTPQAIRACKELGAEKVLVVTKKSLIHNWVAEIQRWARKSRTAVLTTADSKIPNTRFIVTNYEVAVKHKDKLLKCKFDALVVDEATAIKNRKAKRTKALHKLAKNIPHKFLLTGTPVHNRPDELWSLLHCVNPAKYTSYWRFVGRYCLTVENYWGGLDILGVKDQGALAAELAPVMLRRTKELLRLPPKSFETIYVGLTDTQRQIYNDLRTRLFVELEGKTVTAPSVLVQLTRLRQVVCSPALIGGPDESAKTDALLDILDDTAGGHKIIIFTTFAEYVKLLMLRLEPWGTVRITGDMTDKARWNSVEKFQNDPSCRVLVGTIGAMGEGLNLTAADVVIFLNREWVPALNAQAEDRAYRRGQSKPVHVINLVATQTVDQHVEKLLSKKRDVVSQVEALEAIITGLRNDSK